MPLPVASSNLQLATLIKTDSYTLNAGIQDRLITKFSALESGN